MALNLTKLDEVKARMAVLNVNAVVLLDGSGSMDWNKMPNGQTFWEAGAKQVGAVAGEMIQYDDDGIDVVVFDSGIEFISNVTPDTVADVLSDSPPGGSTNVAAALNAVWDKYLPNTKETSGGGLFSSKKTTYKPRKPEKPLCVLVYTDGAPDSKQALKDSIIDATKRVTADEDLGILFIQVGHDSGCKRTLDELDNGLTSQGAAFDCVATCNLDDLPKIPTEDLIRLAFTG
jgi:hypothetical protein